MENFLDLLNAMRGAKGITLTLVVWSIILGIVISWIIIFCKQKITGAFVRAILSAEAVTPETAKTAAELEQDGNVSALSKYSRSKSLRRLIKSSPETLPPTEDTRFYIEKDDISRASQLYGTKETPVWVMIVGAAALLAVGIAISLLTL